MNRYSVIRIDTLLYTLGGFANEKHRLVPGRRWTHEEEQYLIANYYRLKVRDIAHKLNRSTPTCYTRANTLGLSNNADRPWTGEETQRLLYLRYDRGQSTRGIMRELDRTYFAIKRKLALVKQEKRLAA
jgi:hypothetical protein